MGFLHRAGGSRGVGLGAREEEGRVAESLGGSNWH